MRDRRARGPQDPVDLPTGGGREAVAFGVAVVLVATPFLWPFAVAAVAGLPSPTFTDFDIFVVAGRLARAGHLALAYDYDTMRAAAPTVGAPAGRWLAYGYPPTMALVLARLSALPSSTAYLVAQAVSLAVLATGLSRLATPAARPWVLVAALPLSAFELVSGQNGLLTAGIGTWAASATLRPRPVAAGALAALATLKPHLAIGIPTLINWRRDRRGLLAFALTLVALVAASVVEFGASSWPAYLDATRLSSSTLAAGGFPLARFTTAYAAGRGLGLRGYFPMVVHLLVLGLVTALAARSARREPDRRAVAGLAILWATFVSPYAYDYDGLAYVVAAALMADAVVDAVGAVASSALLAIASLAPLVGLAWWQMGGRGGVSAYPILAGTIVAVSALSSTASRRREREDLRMARPTPPSTSAMATPTVSAV